MKITEQMLTMFPSNELQSTKEMIENIIQARKEEYKKELWDNIIMSIKKYQQEIEPIKILVPFNDSIAFIYELSTPGKIEVEYEEVP